MLIEPALNVVLGAPFTVTVEWTSTETKSDGTVVIHRRVSRIMRDSLGRQRFEDGQDEAGPQAGENPTVRLYNPAKRLFASLDAKTGVARISTMGWTTAAPTKGTTSPGTIQPVSASASHVQTSEILPNGVTRETLPPRDIVGLHALGVRTTTTIPGGKEGSPALTVVDEVWESPQWKMPLLHIHDDPRQGRSQAQVTELAREEPDASLMQPPSGYSEDRWEDAGHFQVVLPKVSPLPAPILDSDLAKAADRMFASATAHTEDLKAPYHERYELTMVDYKGQKHSGSVESWISNAGSRREVHTDTYNYVHVADYATGRQWEEKDGIEPLRVKEFTWNALYPMYVQSRLLHPTSIQGGKLHNDDTIPSLSPETVGDAQLTCATNAANAKMCFDLGTGFLVSGSLNTGRIAYEGWRKIGMKYRESALMISQDKKLLVEARLTIASETFSDEIFQKIDGLRELVQREPGSMRTSPDTEPQHRIRGYIPPTTGHPIIANGYAQVRVSVDAKGKVTQAEVEDADDEQAAAAALQRAQNTLYIPEKIEGQPAGFEAVTNYSFETNKTVSY
jgi:hypothetical protein